MNVACNILEAIEGRKDISSILWLVQCTECDIKIEDIKIMKLAVQLIGADIPLVAVFNTGHPKNVCVKIEEVFIRKSAEVYCKPYL